MATKQTVGARVSVRIGGQFFTVEIYREANRLDCQIWSGGESGGLYLGRLGLDDGREWPLFTVVREGSVETLRLVLVTLGLLEIRDARRTVRALNAVRQQRASEGKRYAITRRRLASFGMVVQ